MKNILVTGGAGFIGTNLIKRLLEKNYNVISIDNYSTGLKENHQFGVNYIEADIRNYNYNNLTDIDLVFHLAAIARIQPSFKNPINYLETNINGTLYIAEYCAKNNIPLIYAGSSSHHSGKFKNPYTFSKDVGEEIIELYQKHFNLNASITRFYNVYGPYHLKEGGYCTLIGAWEKMIEEEKVLVIYGDGTKRRDFTHVDDIVDALIKIEEKSAWGHVFELGRGENYSVLEIAKLFDKKYIFLDDKPGEALITLCDNSLAEKVLNWKPIKNIKDYIKNYKKNL